MIRSLQTAVQQFIALQKIAIIEVGPTALALPTTFTYDLDLQSPVNYGHAWPTHMQNFKVNSQWVWKIEWKQRDGQTDGGECSSHANAVGKSD